MSVTAPKGFRAAGVAAGLKASGGLDVALVVNDGPDATAAGVFTANRVKAAPVLWSQQVLRAGIVRAVVLNSGGANACTGRAGLPGHPRDGRARRREAATAGEPAAWSSVPADVAVCSTGLIGERLPMPKLLAGVDAAVRGLGRDGGPAAAEAIMTTDTRPKTTTSPGDGLVGRRHGQGRRHARAGPGHDAVRAHHRRGGRLVDAGRRAARGHADTLGPASTPTAASPPTTPCCCWPAAHRGSRRPRRSSTEAVTAACHDLALQLLADAEGSTKDVAIEVRSAASEADARRGRPGRGPQQPGQDRAVRRRPQLGPDPGRGRHHDGRVRARRGSAWPSTASGCAGRARRPRTGPRWTCQRPGRAHRRRPRRRRATRRPSGPTTCRSPTSTRTRRTRHDRRSGPAAPGTSASRWARRAR